MKGITRKALAMLCVVTIVVVGLFALPQEAVAATKPTLEIGRVNTGKLTIRKGVSYKLGAEATKGAKLSYKSSKPKVVSVSKTGALRALKKGSAYITVTAKKGTAKTTKKVKVSVVAPSGFKPVKSLKVAPTKKTLALGKSLKLRITLTPTNASNKNIVYKSSNTKVATVTASGKVVARKPGTAKITVTSADNARAKKVVQITVKAASVSGVPVRNSFASYSWAELKSIANAISAAKSDAAGLSIAKEYHLTDASGKLTGETKSVSIGGLATAAENELPMSDVRVAGIRHDTKVGGGKAGVTFEFETVVAAHAMNNALTISGGWAACDMRSWLNNDFFYTLPSEFRSNIVEVKKATNNTGNTGDPTKVTNTNDKLWLLSYTEVYGDAYNGWYGRDVLNVEGSQYKFYRDTETTYLHTFYVHKEGLQSFDSTCQGSWWWLRTPQPLGPNFPEEDVYCFRVAGSGGSSGALNCNELGGVSPGFCY